MDTAEQVQELLRHGAARFEAYEAVNSKNIHGLMHAIREIYQRVYGRVALDLHDWRWQAQALKNHIVNHGPPKRDAGGTDVAPPADSTLVPPNRPGDPHTRGIGVAPESQGNIRPVSTAAPGTPTSIGTPTDLGKPQSIKPVPDPADPTDASFIKTQPDVTIPAQGGVTDTPGSPAADATHQP